MKKLVSFVLVLTMLFAVMSPVAFAADVKVKDMTPIVYIRGNGEPIYDESGDEIPVEFADLFDENIVSDEEGITKEKLIESCVNILLRFLTEGLLMDKWDNYGEALYEEFAPLFEKAVLDGNGNPKYGTGVSPEALAKSEYNAANIDFKDPDVLGYYCIGQYDFCYDWRLSPYDHVDRLHEYILTVMETTGSDGICIAARCLGGGSKNCYVKPMTEDNCASFEWLGAAETNPTLETKLASLIRWLTTILNFLVKLLRGEISLGGVK